MRFLIIESPPGSGSEVSRALTANPAFLTHIISTNDEELERLVTRGFDAIIIAAPFQSARSPIVRLRQTRHSLPIVAVASGADKSSMIALIGSGADHCLTRSLDTGELNSRIIALIRRSRGYVTSCIEIGNLRVDITEGRALRSEIPLDLSPEEYRLIECLVVRRGQSVFVNEIAIEVFGTTLDGQARVEKGVASLLRKLGDDSNPTIKSSGAHGYTICY